MSVGFVSGPEVLSLTYRTNALRETFVPPTLLETGGAQTTAPTLGFEVLSITPRERWERSVALQEIGLTNKAGKGWGKTGERKLCRGDIRHHSGSSIPFLEHDIVSLMGTPYIRP